jgi:hypothetical protein
MSKFGRGFKRARKPHNFIPFSGELMRCELCGREEKSEMRVSKGWRCLTLDGHAIYICPDEIARGMTTQQWSDLYVEAVRHYVARTPNYKPAKHVIFWRERFGEITKENLN